MCKIKKISAIASPNIFYGKVEWRKLTNFPYNFPQKDVLQNLNIYEFVSFTFEMSFASKYSKADIVRFRSKHGDVDPQTLKCGFVSPIRISLNAVPDPVFTSASKRIRIQVSIRIQGQKHLNEKFTRKILFFC